MGAIVAIIGIVILFTLSVIATKIIEYVVFGVLRKWWNGGKGENNDDS